MIKVSKYMIILITMWKHPFCVRSVASLTCTSDGLSLHIGLRPRVILSTSRTASSSFFCSICIRASPISRPKHRTTGSGPHLSLDPNTGQLVQGLTYLWTQTRDNWFKASPISGPKHRTTGSGPHLSLDLNTGQLVQGLTYIWT